MFGRKKYDETPVSELQQEKLAQLAIKRLRETGHDPDNVWPPIQHGDPAKMAREQVLLPWRRH